LSEYETATHELVATVGSRWCLRQRGWLLWQNDRIACSRSISIMFLFSSCFFIL